MKDVNIQVPRDQFWKSHSVFNELDRIKSESPVLRSLTIVWNIHAAFEDFATLIDRILEIKLLGSLIIFDVAIGASEAGSIKRLIAETKSLYKILLKNGGLNDENALMTMLDGLCDNETLEEFHMDFDFRQTRKQKISSYRIGQIIQNAKFLRILDYDGKLEDLDEYLEPFSKSLQSNRLLQRIPSYLQSALSDFQPEDFDSSDSEHSMHQYLDHPNSIDTFGKRYRLDYRRFIAWEIWRVLNCCRAISGSRLKEGYSGVFPCEIYSIICVKLVDEAEWLGERVLSLIARCALDRRTVGSLHLRSSKFSVMKLAYVCRRLLTGNYP
jgi:hypothetical protein